MARTSYDKTSFVSFSSRTRGVAGRGHGRGAQSAGPGAQGTGCRGGRGPGAGRRSSFPPRRAALLAPNLPPGGPCAPACRRVPRRTPRGGARTRRRVGRVFARAVGSRARAGPGRPACPPASFYTRVAPRPRALPRGRARRTAGVGDGTTVSVRVTPAQCGERARTVDASRRGTHAGRPQGKTLAFERTFLL